MATSSRRITKDPANDCPDRTCPLMADDGPRVWVNGRSTLPVPADVLEQVDLESECPVYFERGELLRIIGEHFTREELLAAAAGRVPVA